MQNLFNLVINQTKTILEASQDKKTTIQAYKIRRNREFILRANDRSKCISSTVVNLICHFIFRLNLHETLIISHAQISKITLCKPRQNANLLKYLADIFHIKFHKAVTVNGKKYHNVFTVNYTKDGREILEDPKAYYNKKISSSKEDKEPVKINAPEEKILPNEERKITGSIYKEINNKNKINLDREVSESVTNCSRLENLSTSIPFEKKGEFVEAIQQKGTLRLKDYCSLLKDEDYMELKQLSGRRFSTAEMKAITQKIEKKNRLKDLFFKCKATFMKYMGKLLKGEMQQEGFIKRNSNEFVPKEDPVKDYKPEGLTGIWGEMRKQLIEIYGLPYDKAYFSTLKPHVDEDKKVLYLKAPDEFTQERIQIFYGHHIERLLPENYQYRIYYE